jgi:glyoxylate/hydroxypyruvate reductase A
MSIALIFTKNDPLPWRDRLQKKLPDVIIECHPNVKDKDDVRFALCWKPEPGVFKQYKNLEVVQSLGAGVDHILDTQLLGDIRLTRVVDQNLSHDMWEYLLLGVLQYIKNFPAFQRYQLQRKWQPHRYSTIQDTHVSIMGLGKIGEYVARKFAETGFTVSGWSNTKKNIPGVESYGKEDLDQFLNRSNILINILPLTPDTKGILDLKLFDKLQKGAYVINVGRGEHLVEEDLIEALERDQLSGALLDVFASEPLPESHPFWTKTKITITPHVASVTNINSASELIVENYNRMLSNQPLLHLVSQAKGY